MCLWGMKFQHLGILTFEEQDFPSLSLKLGMVNGYRYTKRWEAKSRITMVIQALSWTAFAFPPLIVWS
jgi:hypothetical protein